MKVIYLDLDGPINVHSNKYMSPKNSDNWQDYCNLGSFNIYSPAMVEAINTLVSKYDVHIILASTWEESGRDFASQVGLLGAETFKVLPAKEHDMIVEEWLKFDSVKEHFERFQPEKAVWIDDDLPYQKKALDWSKAHEIKLLVPNTITGITPSMIGDLNLYFEDSPYPDIDLDMF